MRVNKNTFVLLFIGAHIIGALLYIEKENRYVKQLFLLQKTDKDLSFLHKKKQELLNKLYGLKNNQAIKQYAQAQGMQQTSLKSVKKLPQYE